MRPSQWAYQLGLHEWNQLHKLVRKQAGKLLRAPEERQKECKEVALWWNQQCLHSDCKIAHHPAHFPTDFSLWCRPVEDPWAIFFFFFLRKLPLFSVWPHIWKTSLWWLSPTLRLQLILSFQRCNCNKYWAKPFRGVAAAENKRHWFLHSIIIQTQSQEEEDKGP